MDKVFGLDRHNLTTYKLRNDVAPVSDLSFSALYNNIFQGSLRFWPVLIKGAYKPLLLGPLAVDPARKGQAIGVALVRNGLSRAKELGYDVVVLVGNFEYYKRFGFINSSKISLDGYYDKSRLLIKNLQKEDISNVYGIVSKFK